MKDKSKSAVKDGLIDRQKANVKDAYKPTEGNQRMPKGSDRA